MGRALPQTVLPFGPLVKCKDGRMPLPSNAVLSIDCRKPYGIAAGVSDLHFTPMCAMLLTVAEGEQHGIPVLCPHYHSDQVISGSLL